MNKRGAEISVNIIIIAAIALIVLVVIVAIFTGRIGLFSTGVEKTANCEQACASLSKTMVAPVTDTNKCHATDTQIPGMTNGIVNMGGVDKPRPCCCKTA
jgi:uncharacterized membrane protein YvbJ